MENSFTQGQTTAALMSEIDLFLSKASVFPLQQASKMLYAINQKNLSKKKNILFLGSTNSGKSSLINAMLSQKLLRTGIGAETAAISFIINGPDSGAVLISKKVSGEPSEEIPLLQFQNSYRADILGDEQAREIDHVQITTSKISPEYLFIDTPDVSYCQKNDLPLNNALNLADAIICVLTTAQLLNLTEKQWLKNLLSNANRYKLFFAVNCIAIHSQEEMDALDLYLRNELSAYIADTNGHTSPDLFDKHVFYIDALLAEAARTPSLNSREDTVASEDISYSGVPELEEAIYTYAQTSACAVNYWNRSSELMQQMITAAEESLSAEEKSLSCIVERLNQEKEQLCGKKQQLEKSLTEVQCLLDELGQALAENTLRNYDWMVEEIDRDWETYAKTLRIKFGVAEQAHIAYLQTTKGFHELEKQLLGSSEPVDEDLIFEKEMGEILQPIMNALTVFLESHQQKMIEKAAGENLRIIGLYNPLLNKLCEQIEQIDTTLFSQTDAIQTLFVAASDTHRSLPVTGSFSNVLLSLLLFQNTTMAYDMIFKKASVDKLLAEGISRKATTIMVDLTIGVLSGGGYLAGVLLHGAYKIIRRMQKAEQYGKDIFISFKEPILKEMSDSHEYVGCATRSLTHDNLNELRGYIVKSFEYKVDLAEEQINQNLQQAYQYRENGMIEIESKRERINEMRQRLKNSSALILNFQ